jgi:hypothetical protein
MKATSDLLLTVGPDVVLALGDTQYEIGAAGAFAASYHPTWGRLKAVTRPVPGNHEYATPGAAGYFDYFGAAAGDPAKGWYSFDAGLWHVVVLNSNCAAAGGCGAGSPQETWLRADLAGRSGVCTVAAWHHPRWSSGSHGDDPLSDSFWRALWEAGADIILNGHDHDYERFAPMDPDGRPDPTHGVRQFVVGTGGKNQTPFGAPKPGSEFRGTAPFGVLKLALRPGGYDWAYLSAPSGATSDSGMRACNSAPKPTGFVPVEPCRVADTRLPGGPSGEPSIGAGETRAFPVSSLCGVPPSALAAAVNVTAVGASQDGELRLGPAGLPVPLTTTVRFGVGRARAGSAVGRLGPGGRLAVEAAMAAGTVDVVIDLSGYFTGLPPN